MRYILHLALCLLCLTAWGQPSKSDFIWQLNGDERRSQSLLKLIEVNNNEFIGVGYTTNNTEGGKDILVVKLNNNGQIVAHKQLGGRGDDIATGIAMNGEGKIYVCGYSYTKKEVQGFILEFNADLTNTLFFFDEDSKNSMFEDIIIDAENNIYVCGTSNKKMITLALNGDGKLLKKYINLEEGESAGYAMTFTKDGEILVTGSTEYKKSMNKKAVAIMRINKSMEQKAAYLYAQDNCFVGKDILELPNGNIAIACTGIPRNRVECPSLAVISAKGEQLYGKTFPQFFRGEATGLALTPAGDLFITGSGNISRGADRTDAFVIRVNPQNYGEPVWKNGYFFGGPQNDMCNGVFVSADGQIMLYGFKQNLLYSEDLFVYVIKPSDRDIAALNILEKVAFNEFPEFTLNRNAENRVLIQLKNTATSTVNKFKLKITNIDEVAHVSLPEYLISEELKPGETRSLILPIKVGADFKANSMRIRYVVTGSSDKSYASNTVTYKIGKLFEPEIKIILPTTPIDFANRNRIVIPVQMVNQGNVDALVTSMDIVLSENLQFASDFEFPIDINLKQGAPFSFNLVLSADSLFNSDEVPLAFVTQDLAGLRRDQQLHNRTVNRQTIKVKNLPVLLPEQPELVMENSAVSFSILNLQKKVTLFDKQTYEIEIASNVPKKDLLKSLNLSVNKKKVDMAALSDISDQGTYKISLPLQEGTNTLTARFEGGDEQELSTITVQKQKVNYYIYAIGTDLKNEDGQAVMQYSIKDCNDFAAVMKKLERQQMIPRYESAKVNVYDTYTKTTAHQINAIFNDLRKNKKKFKPNDVIIFYWVAQAFSDKDGQIWVKGSDLFASRKHRFTPEEFSVPLTKYFIPYHLNEIPCRKIMMLDIFNKNTNGEEKEESTNDLIDHTIKAIKTHENFDFILAGDIGQQSYEIEKLGNGAFTAAVIKALSDEKGADANQDGIIDLAELFDNISTVVPDLVKNHRKEKTWIQTPRRLRASSFDDVIVYFKE